MATVETILDSLERMKAAGMKGAPNELTRAQLVEWSLAFADIPDDQFNNAVTELIRTEIFFPAVASLSILAVKKATQQSSLAWLKVRHLLRDKPQLRVGEEVGQSSAGVAILRLVRGYSLSDIDDPYALWAMSQMANIETLAHIEQPTRFEEQKRWEFNRLYEVAWRNGYKLTSWDGVQRTLPEGEKALSQSPQVGATQLVSSER